MSHHSSILTSKSAGWPGFRRKAFYIKDDIQNEQLYEAYQAGEVVIFPHLDCLIRYIDELEKFHAEYEGGSFSSDLEMESKLRELYWEKPTNQFTALARKGYKIPGTSGTHSTLFSTADPSLAWKYEQLKFTDAVESWTLNSGSLGDSEIFDVLKTTEDQLAATNWLDILVHRRKNWRAFLSERPLFVTELPPHDLP